MKKNLTIFLFPCLLICFIFYSCVDMKEVEEFNVTFETNGGTTVPPQTVPKGKKAIRPQNPYKDRNVFAGWYQDNNFDKSFSFEMPIISDKTLYAKWREACVVYFNTGEGGSLILPDTVPVGGLPTKPEDPVKDGNVFAGWYDSDLVAPFNFANTILYKDTTLHAKWLPSIKVVFITNSSVTVNSIEVLQGDVVSKPENPVVADSTFMGWFTDEACINLFDFGTPIEQETRLYAGWLTNKFNITVLANATIAINGLKNEYASETKIYIPGNIGGVKVTRIWDNAFKDNTNITELIIEENITNLHPNSFKGCSALSSVSLPENSLTGIGNYCFQLCTSLTGTFIIPDCVMGMGAGAFTQCSNLEEVQISVGLPYVPRAFVGCSKLKKVVLKRSSVPELKAVDAFGGSHADLKIYVPADLIEQYRAAANWSNYATKFVALP